jgi:uncharacterized protein (DUF2336 family)
MTSSAKQVIDQFNAALGKVSSAEQLDVQRKVADLLLSSTAPYSERQVAILNDVMNGLIERIDRPALLELLGRLAAAENAPSAVIGNLSSNDDITVAGPMLEKSKVLSDESLIEIAKTKGQAHLMAIASRRQVSETVTDALVDRGVADVTQKVIANDGAKLSELGYVKVVHEARTDEQLATALAERKDVPPELRPFLNLAHAQANAPAPAKPQVPAKPQAPAKPGRPAPPAAAVAKPAQPQQPQDKTKLPEKPRPPAKPKRVEKWERISRSSWDR